MSTDPRSANYRTMPAWQRFRDQLKTLSVRLGGHLPVPSPRLTHLATGATDLNWFLLSGRQAALSLEAMLARNQLSLNKMSAVLDFGCGLGRVLRHFEKVKGPRFYGCDGNPELIAWCQPNLTFAEFKVNSLAGRLDYPAAQFDLIYALSVFTHLTLPQQDFWMQELGRLLKPGGHLLLSVRGEHYLKDLTPDQQAAFQAGERLVLGGDPAGASICTAYHSPRAVREHLAVGYAVIDFVPEGALGNPVQDYWLLRKPA